MRKRNITIIAATVVLMAGLGIFLRGRDRVGYHLRAIHNLQRLRPPSSFVDYFKPNVWEWYLQGRPNFIQNQKRISEHYQALVDLGRFEIRDFKLTNRSADQTGMQEFYSLTTNIAFSDHNAMWTTAHNDPSIITVTANRKDMPQWESLVSRFDVKGLQ